MSGSSGIGTHAVARDSSPFLSVADDQNISSLLAGTAWNGISITYSFPTSGNFYGTQGAPLQFSNFREFLRNGGGPRPTGPLQRIPARPPPPALRATRRGPART